MVVVGHSAQECCVEAGPGARCTAYSRRSSACTPPLPTVPQPPPRSAPPSTFYTVEPSHEHSHTHAMDLQGTELRRGHPPRDWRSTPIHRSRTTPTRAAPPSLPRPPRRARSPYTPHHTPYTLHPSPHTLHPIPHTLHHTLHPTPTHNRCSLPSLPS